jgi:hypothetical protein
MSCKPDICCEKHDLPMEHDEGVELGCARCMEERPLLSFEALREEGILWLINRVVFHPRGYALALVYDGEPEIKGWTLQGDGSEPWQFDAKDDDHCFARVEAFIASMRAMPERSA